MPTLTEVRARSKEAQRIVHATIERLRWLRRQRDEAVAQRDELRAVLAPLLARPYADDRDGCLFCESTLSWLDYDADLVDEHRPGCPVLRRDALLGREAPRG